MANEKETYKDNELYKDVKETEREVAKNPPRDEKIVLTGQEAEDVQETIEEVGKKVDIQTESGIKNDGDTTSGDVSEAGTSVVDAKLNRRAENLSSGATHNDTGIFPQP